MRMIVHEQQEITLQNQKLHELRPKQRFGCIRHSKVFKAPASQKDWPLVSIMAIVSVVLKSRDSMVSSKS